MDDKRRQARRILVTGASGALGPRVVEAFVESGCVVRTLSLKAPSAGVLSDRTENLEGDICNREAVGAAMGNVSAVVHLAAKLHVPDPTAEMRQEYERVNITGTDVVVRAAQASGVERLVFLSTISVYGGGSPGVLCESSTPRPTTIYAQTKLAAEQIVRGARRTDGQPLGLVLRLGAVYGSRVKGNYQRLLRALSRRGFLPIGNGMNRRTVVYDRDVARAVVLATEHPAAAGHCFNVTDGQCHELREIIAAICQALGRKTPAWTVPEWSARLAANVAEKAMTTVGYRLALTRAIDKYMEDVAVSGERIQAQLGFIPQYSLTEGWQEAVREMRRDGSL